jgi:uncharacterized protein YjbJ (UPF0337 family)
MRIGTIDLNKLRGLSDKAIGFGKEVFGTVIDNERLEQEGQAQQDRATETLKALRKEFQAQAKEAKAEAFEKQQKAAQRVKESA